MTPERSEHSAIDVLDRRHVIAGDSSAWLQ